MIQGFLLSESNHYLTQVKNKNKFVNHNNSIVITYVWYSIMLKLGTWCHTVMELLQYATAKCPNIQLSCYESVNCSKMKLSIMQSCTGYNFFTIISRVIVGISSQDIQSLNLNNVLWCCSYFATFWKINTSRPI